MTIDRQDVTVVGLTGLGLALLGAGVFLLLGFGGVLVVVGVALLNAARGA